MKGSQGKDCLTRTLLMAMPVFLISRLFSYNGHIFPIKDIMGPSFPSLPDGCIASVQCRLTAVKQSVTVAKGTRHAAENTGGKA